MGVPKFYRWISERYPKINQIVSDNALLPEFDHLYLDMNGIIHGCTHPNHMDVSDVLSEREMMLGIMQYLDRIITQIVKPKVSVYMAIDGVAPRAKLNQQRSRRFRSAKDTAEATKNMPRDEEGNLRDRSSVFDSNCITPGTEFLAKVSETIKYFIRKKIKEDPLWHGLTVIFSGHDIPGEGEHKIMQHIREMRNQPGYQPNTRHCIYGQDADLIMLGLVTHEPHFTILREVIDFNFNFNNVTTLKAIKKFTKESDFQLLHLSVLREYLQYEFMYQEPKDKFDLERTIDDFVFMTFLVGNDFLPHMPTLDIGDGAFDLLFGIYKEQRHEWGQGQYLTESGYISDPSRLEKFLAAIGAVESDILEQREKDEAAYVKKRRKWDKRDGKPDGPSDAELKAEESEKQNDYLSMMENVMTNKSIENGDFVEGWKPIQAGEKDFKGRYYFEKMKLTPVSKEEHWHLRRSYMEGLMWCLAYYYRGCISWGWFYPYHYGPMLSDLIDIPRMFAEIKFDLGEPLTPFQQLMGCLPPASSALVPKLYRWLMTSPESPIIQFYPEEFAVDMNGKKNPWEGVNLLPFIEIKLLKDTIAEHCPSSKLTDYERTRNSIGKVYLYRYDQTCTDIVKSPHKNLGLPDISVCHSSVATIDHVAISPSVTFKPELLPGTQIPYPGFPSLNVLPIAYVELMPVGLNCFGTPSKYPNMMLTLHQMPELPALELLADNVLGKSLFVNWPMMHEGKAVAISNVEKEIRLNKGKKVVKNHSKMQSERWEQDAQIMSDMYHIGNGVPGSGGVQIGEIQIRLKIVPLQGMKTNPNGSTRKVFGREEADVPLQLALWQAPAPDPRFQERGPLTLQDRFPSGCNVVLTKGKYRGCMGSVVGVVDDKNVGVKVLTLPAEIPFGLAIARTVQESFVSSVDAARILKIHPGVFGKVMGRLGFEGRYDLGLNLKSPDGTCVVGYTRKKVEINTDDNKRDDKNSAWAAGDSVLVVGSKRNNGQDDDEKEERIQWEYTPKAIRLVKEFREKFPQLFIALSKKPNEKKYNADEVFGPNGKAWLPVVREWLDKHETAKLPRTPVTTEAMSYEATAAVEKAADVRTLALKKRGFPKESLIKIPGTALYREGSTGATDILLASDFNNNHAPELGDRIVNLCADGIPFGARGTVVGIHEAASTGSVEVVMDEEFIGGSSLQGACSNFRGKLCLWTHLLKVSTDNSKAHVDKLVPRSKQTAPHKAVDKIISSIDPQANETGHIKSSLDTQVHTESKFSSKKEEALKLQKAILASPPRAPPTPSNGTTSGKSKQHVTPPRSTTPKKSSSRAASSSRAGSTGRGRQIAWREAKGPDEKGVGFKGARKGGISGFKKWKNLISSTPPSDRAPVSADVVNQTAEGLKNMLGISSAPAREFSNSAQSQNSAADDLKNLLGVNSSVVESQRATGPATPNASEGLKAMLGVACVATVDTPQETKLQEPPAPASAAERLMQLMANKQPQGPPSNYPPGPPRTGFNFTYVEEGKEPPEQAHHMPQPPPHLGFFGGMPPGHPMPMPPPHMYPYGGPPPPPPHFGFHPPPPPPPGPSPEEFPPLGASPKTRKETGDRPTTNPSTQNVKPVEKPKAMALVPSVVASKGKR